MGGTSRVKHENKEINLIKIQTSHVFDEYICVCFFFFNFFARREFITRMANVMSGENFTFDEIKAEVGERREVEKFTQDTTKSGTREIPPKDSSNCTTTRRRLHDVHMRLQQVK